MDATTQPTKCGKCHRVLRDPKSIARGYGPTCATKIDKNTAKISIGWKPAQVAKATKLIADRRIVRIGHLYLAESSKGDTRYPCSPTGECSCVAAYHGGRCYHTLAASILAA